MANLDGFNANEVEPTTGYDAIPAGEYPAVITDSEMKATKAGTGEYLKLTFQVVGGPYKNRLLWTRLNLDNPNEKAVQIARGELSAICRAVEVPEPKDSSELHDRPLLITVKCKESDYNGEMENVIKGYSKAVVGQSHPAPEAQNTRPWSR